MRWYRGVLTAVVLGAVLASSAPVTARVTGKSVVATRGRDVESATTTPITHLVVIFQENVSFDHYFGTYPNATNPSGEPAFTPAPETPSVNGLTAGLLSNNPNAANPQRLDRSEALTCDQDHNYADEQQAFDHGLMDMFVEKTSGSRTGGVTGPDCVTPLSGHTVDTTTNKLVMDYYDGNTVTGLWNYAQHFALNDNSFGTAFGPSTVGALNLISGQTHGATPTTMANAVSNGTVIGDPRPVYDDCYTRTNVISMTGTNVGDLLNARGITWGWFQGGFRPTTPYSGTTPAVCGSAHQNIGGATVTDYIPHHEPFQYYQQTANPHHLPPSSVAMIGQTDQANHQYDLADFWAAADSGHLPAVSFLKAAGYQDGHAGYSDPLDEQTFLVTTINHLEGLPTWKNTAVIIAYDDSDGWYDHVMGPILSQSSDPTYDALTAPGQCGTAAKEYGYPDRCGYGPRLPLLVISPYARTNYVDHTVTDQSSILRFIEDNWGLGRIGNYSFDALAGSLDNLFNFSGEHRAPKLFLDAFTGEPTGGAGATATPTVAVSATVSPTATAAVATPTLGATTFATLTTTTSPATATTTTSPATATTTATAGPPSATTTATSPPSATATSLPSATTTSPPSATATAGPPSATTTATSPPSATATSLPSATTTSPPSATATAGPPSATATSPTAQPSQTATTPPTSEPTVCALDALPVFDPARQGSDQGILYLVAPGSVVRTTIDGTRIGHSGKTYPATATLYTFDNTGPGDEGQPLVGTKVSRGYRYSFTLGADSSGLALLVFHIPSRARPGTVTIRTAAQEPCGRLGTQTSFQVVRADRDSTETAAYRAFVAKDTAVAHVTLSRADVLPAGTPRLIKRGVLRVTRVKQGHTTLRRLALIYRRAQHPARSSQPRTHK